MTNNIQSRDEAVYRLVAEPIAAGDGVTDAAAEYDIDAIADEVLIWDDAYDAERNAYLLDYQGWRYAPAFDHLHDDYEGDDAFWDCVARHERADA